MQDNFIYDQYTESRGEPSMLKILCSSCNEFLCDYQKDGPGPLLRCYCDRIHSPKDLKKAIQNSTPQLLCCRQCGQTIGEKGIYEKEQRLAFFLKEGSFVITQEDPGTNH